MEVPMHVRIVKRPLGEAPEHIRDAWIGLLLPVELHFPRVVQGHGLGVLTGLPSWMGAQAALWHGSTGHEKGYVVESSAALDVLAAANPQAAEWWRTNTPHLWERGKWLGFDEECCVVEDPASSP
jgi:hypothetical protein